MIVPTLTGGEGAPPGTAKSDAEWLAELEK